MRLFEAPSLPWFSGLAGICVGSLFELSIYRVSNTELQGFFASRRNWDSPNPQANVPPPPLPGFWGEGHTRWRERGWKSPNSNEGMDTMALKVRYIYVLFGKCLSRLPHLFHYVTWYRLYVKCSSSQKILL